ncbi:MAG: hypothetical protein HC876_07860 [Chloroflexaceae bacterium]|nr:hypothetical protein [Chloroflexaceae bacterium]
MPQRSGRIIWLLVALLALGGGSILIGMHVPSGTTPGTLVATTATPVTSVLLRATSTSTEPPLVLTDTPDSIVVYVVGAVQRPGVYELPAGARVADAVQVAGGLAPDADTESVAVNLALYIADEARVYIPRRGTSGSAVPATNMPEMLPTGAPEQVTLINLNTAGINELQTIPGIGPELAQRIIAYREQKGGFRTLEELLEIRGIGNTTLENLRTHVQIHE